MSKRGGGWHGTHSWPEGTKPAGQQRQMSALESAAGKRHKRRKERYTEKEAGISERAQRWSPVLGRGNQSGGQGHGIHQPLRRLHRVEGDQEAVPKGGGGLPGHPAPLRRDLRAV